LRNRFKIAILAVFLIVVNSGCKDSNAQVNIYDSNITKEKIPCLSLRVFPPNSDIKKSMQRLYPFKSNCPYSLDISYSNGIVCNSNANAPQKTLSQFPSSYLRFEIRKGIRLLYSYYLDLTHSVDSGDLEDTFDRLKSDIKLK